MQTFKFQVELEFSVVVPQQFLNEVRAAVDGTLEDADGIPIPPSPFLEQQKGKSDDDMMIAVLSNGIRLQLREALVNLMLQSGCGVRCAPVRLLRREPLVFATPPKAEQIPADATDVQEQAE